MADTTTTTTANEAPAPATPAPAYDALIFRSPAGPSASARIHAALDFAEPLLGKPCVIGDHGGGRTFAVRTSGDKLFFANDHPRHPQPRYTWVERDGVKYGTYVPGAHDAP